jgi:toxin-antitoxin system PIN domain toxin
VTRALLDVNVLLALLDADHVDHRRTHDWLDDQIAGGWASCPITENGFVRIISQPRYPSPVSPAQAVALLRRASAEAYHEFWPCDASILDAAIVDATRLHGPRQVTDAYLLALATRRDGRFVTFDRSISLGSVVGATERHLAVLG